MRKSLISFCDKSLNLTFLSQQTAFLRFTNTYYKDVLLKNDILLLFKIYVCNSRKHEQNSLNNVIRNVMKVKIMINEKKVMVYNKKWKKNWKQDKRKKSVSLIYPKGCGMKHFCWEMYVVFCYYFFMSFLFVFLLYFIHLFFFCFFFVCVSAITFRGSFLILFWCCLIKNEINIKKRKNH